MAEIGTAPFSRTKQFDQEERKERIFNAKERTIGVDKDFLAQQVAEKGAAAAADTDRDRYYDKLANYYDQKLVMLEQEKKEIEGALNKDLVSFRAEYQNKERRREFDMSDPDLLKKSLPARVGDDDYRNSISGAQKFEGEDLSAGERKKLQLAQQASWCKQQMAEKQAIAANDKEEMLAYCELLRKQEEYQTKVAKMQESARADLKKTIAEENFVLAEEKKAKEAYMAQMTLAQNTNEQANMVKNDMLCENPTLAVSHAAPYTRVRKDHWKGMSEDEVANVQEMQATQREELKARKMAELDAERRYATQQENFRRTMEMKAQQVEDFKKEQRMQVAATINAQKAEHNTKEATMKKNSSQVPTADFFGQFGTSAR